MRVFAPLLLLFFTSFHPLAGRAVEPAAGDAAGGLKPTAYESNPATGTSLAVRVGGFPLVHTAQLLPLHERGEIVAPDDVAAQTRQVIQNLDAALAAADSSLDRVVKLNLYVSDDANVDGAMKIIAQTFTHDPRPACSLVVTRLPDPRALIAADAVAAARRRSEEVKYVRGKSPAGRERPHDAAVLPDGKRIYISGQAEPGDLATATRKTLASLLESLKFLHRGPRDIVQIKAFMSPMSEADVVLREIETLFGENVPPVSLVEWISPLPIEIEVVAAGGGGPRAEASVEYATPPGMKASPVFSRVAIARGDTIFVSGLFAASAAPGQEEVEAIFVQLTKAVEALGGNLRQLAKATYYVSGDESSRALNELRPRYYSPERPPAASKAQVRGVGRPGRTITLDMIAAPAG